jgi:urocanate hydratase
MPKYAPPFLQIQILEGWVQIVETNMDSLVARIRAARQCGDAVSIGFLGNVVEVWERLAAEEELLVELGSDQTSLHNPYGGGYYPVQLSFADANAMMVGDPPRFRELVQESLRRHVAAINKLCARGMRFWDYGARAPHPLRDVTHGRKRVPARGLARRCGCDGGGWAL